jgi:hypothetical protein
VAQIEHMTVGVIVGTITILPSWGRRAEVFEVLRSLLGALSGKGDKS